MNVMLISLYLQYLKEMSLIAAAMIMMIQPTVMAFCTPMVGRKFDNNKAGRYAQMGMLVTTVGLIFLALQDATSSLVHTMVALAVTGLGFSLFSTPNVTLLMSSVEDKDLGLASSAISTTRIIGQLASTVIVTLVFVMQFGRADFSPDNVSLLSSSIQTAFSFAACLCLSGFIFIYTVNKQG